MDKRYRVIQWGTGRIGSVALAGIIEHPGLELVGVAAYTEPKNGKDAGELCRPPAPASGVKATTDHESLLALSADAVLYVPRDRDLDEVCAILESGKNLVSPNYIVQSDGDSERVYAACQRGDASLYCIGINPGFAGTVLPLALSGLSRRIDRITIYEYTNWSNVINPRTTDQMRFGYSHDEAELSANPHAVRVLNYYKGQLSVLAEALGVPIDEVTLEQDLFLATRDHKTASRIIPAGSVSAQRYRWLGLSNGVACLESELLFVVGDEYPDDWPKVELGWTVVIEGLPSLRSSLSFDASYDQILSAEEKAFAGDHTTAMACVNAIPNLCTARPGILQPIDLGLVVGGFGSGSY